MASKFKIMCRETSLYARDRVQEECLAYNEFVYKETKYAYKLEDRSYKNE